MLSLLNMISKEKDQILDILRHEDTISEEH